MCRPRSVEHACPKAHSTARRSMLLMAPRPAAASSPWPVSTASHFCRHWHLHRQGCTPASIDPTFSSVPPRVEFHSAFVSHILYYALMRPTRGQLMQPIAWSQQGSVPCNQAVQHAALLQEATAPLCLDKLAVRVDGQRRGVTVLWGGQAGLKVRQRRAMPPLVMS
jgi:hypothetical protein